MTDRSVKVSLILAAQGYMQGIDQATKKTRELGTEAEKLAQQRQAFETLGRAAIGLGAGMALGVGLAVKQWADFDQQMSYVQAATHETAANMGLLEQAALDAGSRTVYSATEAAAAIEELARAGVSTQDILAGGLDASLDLAAAGGLQVADAAGIAAVALKTFNLQGEDMSHVADLLAAGAGKAMGDVSQLSQALAQGGQVAKQTGLSIEETTAGLSAFAAQGLLGSDAGTSFKSMLQRLTPQSDEAKRKMAELGISAYDAAGNFVGLAEFSGNLQESLRNLTPEARNAAMATIFGSDAVRAATVLYSEGEAGIRDWIDAVDDQGYAAETAAMRLDNLSGDWEAFTGALDTAMISMGQAADGPLRGLVQGLTEVVDGFNELPQPAKDVVMWVGMVTAGVALAGGTALIAVPQIAAFKAAVQTLGIVSSGADGKLGKLTKTLALGGGLVVGIAAASAGAEFLTGALASMGDSAEQTSNKLATAASGAEVLSAALGKGFGGTGDIKAAEQALAGLADMLDQVASGRQGGAGPEILRAANAVERLDDSLAGLVGSDLPLAQQQLRMVAEEAGLNDEQLSTLIDTMGSYKSALTQAATEQGIATDSAEFLQFALGEATTATGDAATVMDEAAAAAEEAVSAFDTMAAALQGIADTALNLGEAKDAALGTINALADAAKQEGAEIAGTNDASIALRDSLREVETAHRDSAQAILENGGTLAEAQAEWQKGRDAVLDMLEAKGLDTTEAAIWAEAQLGSATVVTTALGDVHQAWLDLPENRETKYAIEAAEAEQKLIDLKALLDAIPGHTYKKVTLDSYQVDHFTVSNPDANATGNLWDKGKKVTAFAAGGFASGIYPYKAGGIHKFAEAGPEAYLSLNPAFRDRNLGLWGEVGRRLGAWQPAPAHYASMPSAAADSRPNEINVNVQSQPAMSESQLARKTAGAINKSLR